MLSSHLAYYTRRFRTRTTGALPPSHTEPLECRSLLSTGQLDPTFGGGDGIVSHPDAAINLFPVALAAAPDGKLVALGVDDNPNGSNDFLVARYNADGTLDTAFGSGGYQTTDFTSNRDDPADVIVQADGKIVVAGSTGPAAGGGHALIALARYNPDGTLDATFDGDGRATVDVAPATGSAAAIALAAAPGNKLAVLGSTFDPGPAGGAGVVVRVNPDGSRDTTFDGDGVAVLPLTGPTAPSAMTFGVAPDGKVVIAGVTNFDPNPVGTSGSMSLTRLNADGSPDTSFAGDGVATLHDPDATITDYPDSVLFAGGKIIIGYKTEGNVGADAFDAGVVRVNDDGTVDTTFGSAGYVRISLAGSQQATGVSLAPDGKLLLGFSGDFGETNHVARLTAGGALDTTYGGGDGIGDLPVGNNIPFGPMLDTVLQPTGRSVGLFWYFRGQQTRFGLAALTPEGQSDTTFHFGSEAVDPVGRDGAFRDTAVLPGGKILAVGVTPDGAYLARLNGDGSFDTTFSGDGKVIANLGAGAAFNRVAVQVDGKILAFGTVLARFNPDGSLDTTFGNGTGFVTPSAAGDGLALQPDGKILTAEGNPRDGARVARYNPDGSLDTTFGTGGRVTFNYPIGSAPWKVDEGGGPYDGFVPLDVAWQASSGKIVVGGQTPGFGTITDYGVVRLNGDGSLDRTYANGLGMASADTQDWDIVGRMDVAPDGAIAVSGEEEDEDPTVVLFDNDGNWSRTQRLPWLGDTSDVAFTPDGKIVVVGDADGYDPDTDLPNGDIHVIRLNRDLTVDTSFGGASGVRTDVFGSSEDFPYGVTVAPDGGVLVAGRASNSPVLLRYDGGGLAPTAVTRTFVGSTAWADSFLRYVDRSAGDDRFGVAMPAPTGASAAGQPLTPLPWLNLDVVSIQFNRPVSVSAGDLHVRGVNVAEYGIKNFRYDPNTRTGVWTLDRAIGADKVLLQLDGVEEIGGPFQSRFDVLPGDVTGDRTVLANDYSEVKKRFFKRADDTASSDTSYGIRYDVDGSGAILANDYSEVKKRFFNTLPNGEPTGASGQARTAGVTRELFSNRQVLG
jgi:uncharacterized delta-60 repeat protein